MTWEYYSLRFEEYPLITEYLIKIKTLEKWIRNTNVILDNNKQTLLYLGMTLPKRLQYLVRIWTITPEITTDKARNMLLEKERRIKISDQSLELVFTEIRTRTLNRKAIENSESESESGSGSESGLEPGCPRCGKRHRPEIC